MWALQVSSCQCIQMNFDWVNDFLFQHIQMGMPTLMKMKILSFGA